MIVCGKDSSNHRPWIPPSLDFGERRVRRCLSQRTSLPHRFAQRDRNAPAGYGIPWIRKSVPRAFTSNIRPTPSDLRRMAIICHIVIY